MRAAAWLESVGLAPIPWPFYLGPILFVIIAVALVFAVRKRGRADNSRKNSPKN